MTKEYIMQKIKWHEEIMKLERELQEIANE